MAADQTKEKKKNHKPAKTKKANTGGALVLIRAATFVKLYSSPVRYLINTSYFRSDFHIEK